MGNVEAWETISDLAKNVAIASATCQLAQSLDCDNVAETAAEGADGFGREMLRAAHFAGIVDEDVIKLIDAAMDLENLVDEGLSVIKENEIIATAAAEIARKIEALQTVEGME
jgi:hypothetical protein